MVNLMLGTKCEKWNHGRYAIWHTTLFVQDTKTKLNGDGNQLRSCVARCKQYCKRVLLFGRRLIVNSRCEAEALVMTRLGWVKFRERGDLLHGRRYSLKMKGRIYQTCERSILYGMMNVIERKKISNLEKD